MNERSLGGGSEQMCLTFPGVEYFLTTVRTFQGTFQRAFKLSFFQRAHLKYFLTAVHTFQRIFSLKYTFSKPCQITPAVCQNSQYYW